MEQMGLLRVPNKKKSTSSTTCTSSPSAATSTCTGGSISCSSSSEMKNGNWINNKVAIPMLKRCCCGWLTRLVRKIRKQGRLLTRASVSSTSSSPSSSTTSTARGCRQYDPLGYSLNFDPTECGNLMDDGDYYHFCAFSSRFVQSHPAPPLVPPPCATTTPPSPLILVPAPSHYV